MHRTPGSRSAPSKMDSEDGQSFVKNLAAFVRTHERALANALHLQRQRSGSSSGQQDASSLSGGSGVAPPRSFLQFVSAAAVKPAKLSLTPHHLFYLLSKFEDLGVDVGPMNVRLENLQHDAAVSNYVSFLGRAPKTRGRQADTESLRSVSSMRSVMSNMSSLWTNLTLSNATAKAEKRQAQFREDITYLYACFTKIPALKLSPDPRARPVAGFEEFPFDTAVPLFAFKNVGALEICDLDFRQFHGWDRMAEQLRSLTLRRANVDDPLDLLYHIVLDDMERRRRRSAKTPMPTTPSTPGAPWPNQSPKQRQIELARTLSAPNYSLIDARRRSIHGKSRGVPLIRGETTDGKTRVATPPARQASNSPPLPETPGPGSLGRRLPSGSLQDRRSSGSSLSSGQMDSRRHSGADYLGLYALPSSKWRFLRHLSLAENSLTDLAVISLAPISDTLQSFDLSGNLFTTVPEALASLANLRALNLSNCMIDTLKTLTRHPLPAITVLNLRSNRLPNLVGIERLPSLERVDLRDNSLQDPSELSRLASAPEMTDVYVQKNPFTRTHPNYRITIFNAFRSSPGRVQDVGIDTQGPLSSERKALVDWAPEPVAVPVVRPPLDDELSAEYSGAAGETVQYVSGGAATEAELHALAPRLDPAFEPSYAGQMGYHSGQTPVQRRSQGHRRATSENDILTPRKKKKRPSRRRIVEIAGEQSPIALPPSPSTPVRGSGITPDRQTNASSRVDSAHRAGLTPATPTFPRRSTARNDLESTPGSPALVQSRDLGKPLPPVPALNVNKALPSLNIKTDELPMPLPRTPSESDQPTTPCDDPTPFHTAPSTQLVSHSHCMQLDLDTEGGHVQDSPRQMARSKPPRILGPSRGASQGLDKSMQPGGPGPALANSESIAPVLRIRDQSDIDDDYETSALGIGIESVHSKLSPSPDLVRVDTQKVNNTDIMRLDSFTSESVQTAELSSNSGFEREGEELQPARLYRSRMEALEQEQRQKEQRPQNMLYHKNISETPSEDEAETIQQKFGQKNDSGLSLTDSAHEDEPDPANQKYGSAATTSPTTAVAHGKKETPSSASRSFSPVSRSSTIRPEGRVLGAMKEIA